MTGIFQIFDRYKARLYVKNEPRRAKNGELETKAAPAYYLVEEDGVARRVTPEAAEQRQARSEASKDSRRSSSADAYDMQGKSSTPPRVVESPRVIEPSVAQSPQSKRSLASSEPPNFVSTSWSPQAIQKLQLKKISNERISQGEIETPKSAEATALISRGAGSGGDGPVTRSVAKDGGPPKLPPRAGGGGGGGGARALPNAAVYQKERSKKSAKNYYGIDASVRFDDARVRELMQLKRESQFGSDQDQPQSSSRSKDHATRNHHHPQSSGDERDDVQFRKESRSYVQSSGDEKEGVSHLQSPAAAAVARKDNNPHRHQSSGDEHVDGNKVRREQGDRSFQSSGDEKEAHMRALAVARKDVAHRHLHQHHHHQLSGDEHVDVEKYRKERRSSCQSSGDEKKGHLRSAAVAARKDPPHRHHHHHQSSGDEHVESEVKYRKQEGGRSSLQSSGDEKEGFRYSSATEKYRHEEDSRDVDSRPQYPSDGKELVRSWNSSEGRRNHVIHESQRYQSSGDEVESGRLYHEAAQYNSPVPVERESHRNLVYPVERDDLRQRHHFVTGDGGSDGTSFESSEEERGGPPERPSYASAQKREAAARRHHHGSSGNERGGYRYYSSEERSEAAGRRSHHQVHVSAGRQQAHRSAEKYSGDERVAGHRFHTGRDSHHKLGSSANHRGHRSQAPVEMHERHRYVNSSGEERGGYRYPNSTSSRGHKHKSSSGGLDWRLYQSSGDEKGGRRSSHLPSAGEKELGWKRYSSSADTNNRRRYESSDEELKEDWPGQYSRANIRNEGRRHSTEASDVPRPYSLDAAEELGSRYDGRLNESNHEVRSRYQSSSREEQRYATDPRDNIKRHQQQQLPISDRNIDDSRGGHHHKRQSSASIPKETLRPQSPGEKDASVHSRDLPPRTSGSRITVSPKNLVDIKGLTIRVRDGSQKEPIWEFEKPAKSPHTGQYAMDERANYELQEMMRDVDRESQSRDHGTRHQASADERDPPRTSSVSRVSADSRQYQSSTPRMSVDGREHLRASSLHSSRPSSVDAHSQPRTNFFDTNVSTGEFRRRGGGGSSSVVARLMGLPELPDSDASTSTERNATSRTVGKSLQKFSLNSIPPPELASDHHQLRLSEVALQMKQVAEQFHQDAQLRQTMQLQESGSSARPKRISRGKSMSDIPRSESPPPPSGARDAQNAHKQERPASASASVSSSSGRQAEAGSVHHQPRVPKQPMSPKHYQMEGMPNGFRRHTQDLPMSPRHHQMEGMPNAFRKHTQDLPMSPKYHQMEGAPKQPMSPKHHQMEGMPNAFRKHTQDLPHIEVDQRLHQLRIKNAIQEHKSLKQILEAMHLKGLLHPPQRKPPPPPAAAQSKEQRRLPREEEEAAAHQFLQHAQNPSNKSLTTTPSNSTRPHRPSRQELSGFPKIGAKDTKVNVKVTEVVPPPEIDYTKEASIVLMKPFNHQAAIEEIEDRPSSSQSLVSGIGRNNPSEIKNRGRSSEPRPGFSSGRNSRSRSLESAEQFTMRKGPLDDLSFANVMLSWRERVAAEAAKKATSVVEQSAAEEEEAEAEAVSRSKSLPPFAFKQRSSDSSPSRSTSASIRSVSGWQTPQKLETLRNQPEKSAAVSSTTSKFIEAVQEDPDPENSRNNGLMSASADEIEIGSTTSYPKDSSGVTIEGRHSLDPYPTETCNEPETFEIPRDSRPKAAPFSSPTTNGVLPNFKVTTKKRKIEEPAVLMNLELQLAKELVAVPGTHQKMHVLSEMSVGNESSAMDIPEAAAPKGGFECGNASSSGGRTSQECFVPTSQLSKEESEFLPQLGADYPSPVSVLDNPIFQEGFFPVDEELSPSPNPMELNSSQHQEGADLGFGNIDIAASKHEEDTADILAPPSSSVVIKDMSIDPLKCIHNSLLQPNVPFLTDSPNHRPHHQFDGSHDERNKEAAYVEDILKKSGLTEEASQLGEDITELVHNHVFIRKEKELQSAELNRIVDRGELDKSEVKRYKESLDRKLIFDSMNEILGRKMSPFLHPQPWGTPVVQKKPCGQHLVDEVLEELQAMHWPATDLYDGISSLLQRDFQRKEFQWLDFGVEIGEVGIQLEGMLFQDMVEETLQAVMAIISARKQSQQKLLPTPPSPKLPSPSPSPSPSPLPSPLPSPSPSPPSAMNDSETRRRELLEKTRRDLFAWHVQYQQLA